MDNCLPEWLGALRVEGAGLAGPETVSFSGVNQGVFPGDKRPIRVVPGFSWTTPGFHFLKLTDPVSGLEAWSNPAWVTEETPCERLFWGDPHWQTFFSDGIRIPEQLYAFARDEAFLDFGAISDHMEAITDRQWEYFQAVTNDFNAPGEFATLHGQEWTHHAPERGAPGHRNIYYRGSGGPVLRSNDPNYDTLEKLWQRLDIITADGIQAIAIPHHPASKAMGVNWDLGWNPRYEKAIEIHSVWGNSERHVDDGNPMPILHCGGETRGRHVVDALVRGYRLGFVGGGDIHDGRPGDQLHNESYPPGSARQHPQGFTAVRVPRLTRECVFDAIAARRTYATTQRRIYLDLTPSWKSGTLNLSIRAASEEGIRDAVLVRNGKDGEAAIPGGDDFRTLETAVKTEPLDANEFLYIRLQTGKGNLAWSSPLWGGTGSTDIR